MKMELFESGILDQVVDFFNSKGQLSFESIEKGDAPAKLAGTGPFFGITYNGNLVSWK
jgi:hypothetical protein